MKIYSILFISSIISCYSNSSKIKIYSINDGVTVQSDSCFSERMDTIFKNSSYIKYKWVQTENLFQMYYGNNSFERGTDYYTLCDEKYPLHKGRFNIEFVNDNFIVMSRSSGSFIRKALVLPFDTTKTMFEIDEVVFLDSAKNIIGYFTNDYSPSLVLNLENLVTRQRKQIGLDIGCSFYTKDCILRMEIDNDEFYCNYISSNSTGNSSKEVHISIKDLLK